MASIIGSSKSIVDKKFTIIEDFSSSHKILLFFNLDVIDKTNAENDKSMANTEQQNKIRIKLELLDFNS